VIAVHREGPYAPKKIGAPLKSEQMKPWQWLTDLFTSEKRGTSELQIGLEVERIAIWKDGSAFRYQTDPKTGKPGAGDLLKKLSEVYGWKLVESALSEPIGLETPHGKISLEPGSQLECAVYPQKNLGEVARHLEEYDRQVDEVIRSWDSLVFLGLAVNPIHRLDEIDVIPSPRYHIMTDVLGKTGRYGTTMMRRTSSVQINLDYTSESEAIEMLRVSLLVAPISTALFANSPLLEKKPTGFLSTRAEIWRHTDPDRTGLMKEAFEMGFNFDRYSAYLWKMPLMFVQNNKGDYVNAEGCCLEDIASGKLLDVQLTPTNMRWAIQQLFTEARLKPGYVEVRSVDGQLPPYRLASAAFWMGLLYDPQARKLAFELLGKLSSADRDELWNETSRKALKTEFKGLNIREIAQKLVQASLEGLKKRGFQEEIYLAPLVENVKQGVCPADRIMENFQTRWQGNVLEILKGES
jgi:glutamate--cysteine ligase